MSLTGTDVLECELLPHWCWADNLVSVYKKLQMLYMTFDLFIDWFVVTNDWYHVSCVLNSHQCVPVVRLKRFFIMDIEIDINVGVSC